jgi:hypothetical protein
VPEGPIRPTLVSAVGKPAVAREVDRDSVRKMGLRSSGHRRRTRAGGTSSPGEGAPLQPRRTDVDLGLSTDLPDISPEEEEAERRAMERARGRSFSPPILALASAALFLLPIGLLLGARRLERIQRDREIPMVALRPAEDSTALDSIDSLPLLQPMAPLRVPEVP